jgi:hypothetical protein
MTDRDEMAQRIERAMERYEKARMKPGKRLAWGKVRQNGRRIMLNDADDIPGAGQMFGSRKVSKPRWLSFRELILGFDSIAKNRIKEK